MSDDYYEDLSVGQIHDRGQIIGLGAYWRDERRDYQDDKIIYRGCHHRHNADVTDENWEIWTYIWSDGGNVRIEAPLSCMERFHLCGGGNNRRYNFNESFDGRNLNSIKENKPSVVAFNRH